MLTVNGIETSINPVYIVRILEDYIRKLEIDDFDHEAIKKMRNAREILDELQEVM